MHARGVRVVSVHDEFVVLRLRPLAAVVRRAVRLECLHRRLRGNAEVSAHRDGRQRIGQVVGPDELRLHRVPFAAVHAEAEREEGPVARQLALHLRTRARCAVGKRVESFGRRAEVRVVDVQEHQALGLRREVAVEFRLRLHHALKRAEARQVRCAHVGDEAAVGRHDFAEESNLPGVVRPRFHHGHLVVGAQAEQGEGHADVVVEVALGKQHALPLREHGGGEFLGCRLAVRSRDLQGRRAQRAAVEGRQLLKGFQHVLHAYEARVAGQRGIVHDGRFAARLQGGQRKPVAVEAFAAQGKVELAGSRLARVGSHFGVLPVEAIELF